MSSSPQHLAPAPRDLSGTDAADLALHREKFRRRLPESLDELRGPTHGVVGAHRVGGRLPPARQHPSSRVTDMPELPTRLLADVIALGSPYPLVLTGGYAVRAHRLVNRPSQDLDVATENPAPMADIAAALCSCLKARGWKVQTLETAPLSAR